MLKNSLAAALAMATLIPVGTSLAAGPAHRSNDEAGTVYHGAEYRKVEGKLVRVDTWNTQARARTPEIGDSWEFVGGDSEWQLRQHRFDFVNGRLAHTDDIPHNTPVPARAMDAGNFPKGFGSSGG